jgi:hypothetical protein
VPPRFLRTSSHAPLLHDSCTDLQRRIGGFPDRSPLLLPGPSHPQAISILAQSGVKAALDIDALGHNSTSTSSPRIARAPRRSGATRRPTHLHQVAVEGQGGCGYFWRRRLLHPFGGGQRLCPGLHLDTAVHLDDPHTFIKWRSVVQCFLLCFLPCAGKIYYLMLLMIWLRMVWLSLSS